MSVLGKDGEVHTKEVDGTSLFDAADTVIRDWNRLWWWASGAPIQMESGPGSLASESGHCEEMAQDESFVGHRFYPGRHSIAAIRGGPAGPESAPNMHSRYDDPAVMTFSAAGSVVSTATGFLGDFPASIKVRQSKQSGFDWMKSTVAALQQEQTAMPDGNRSG